MRTPSVIRPCAFGDDTSVRYTSSTSPVCTDGVPIPSVLFGIRRDRRRVGAELAVTLARRVTSAETVVFCAGRVGVRAEVGDACSPTTVADSPLLAA